MVRTAAVIGCGDVSAVHLEALATTPGVELIAVCDIEPASARASGERHHVPWFTDHRDLLRRVRPDVVHLCTPHDTHADLAIDAMAAGVNVLLEKPVAHTVAQAESVTAAAALHPELTVGVCLQNRYNATVQTMRALLESGELGAVLGGSANVLWHRTPEYYRVRPWRGQARRTGSGVLANQAIHTIDLLQWLLGGVTSADGHVSRQRSHPHTDVEDTAQLTLVHEGGARSLVFATVAHVRDAPVALEVVTERAVLDLRQDLTVTYDDGRVERFREPPAPATAREYWGASHAALVADFYASLDRREPFWIGPHEATKSLRVIGAVYDLGSPLPHPGRTTVDVDPVRLR